MGTIFSSAASPTVELPNHFVFKKLDRSTAFRDRETCVPVLTVIIPTRDRIDTLKRTLAAYARQSVAPESFDMIIVDDGSQDGTVAELENDRHNYPFRINVLTQSPSGPARARNRAIDQARGELVLITGDDIIPHERMVESHLNAHRVNPDPRVAVLGFVDWHPDLEVTDFMTYITEVDGHQFAFHHISNPNDVPFCYFYTSNVSLKMSFLRQSGLFSESFRYAACEDIELGFRLKQHGMRLIYAPDAIGYHLHPMDLDSFSQRQFRVGQMMALLLDLHPGILNVPPPPSPEQTLEKISTAKGILERLESYVAKRVSLSELEKQQVQSLRYDIYRELIYGYQSLGICEERRLQGFDSH